VRELFKGVCDYCGRESLPTAMSMCNECAEKEEGRV
jgi:NMD protein affecting ribosome stability and mRNA decay